MWQRDCVGFAGVSGVRTLGDMGARPIGLFEPTQWATIIGFVKQLANYCLAVAMAAVGLGTSIKGLRRIGYRPLAWASRRHSSSVS